MSMPAHQTSEALLPWRNPAFRANPFPWYDVLRREAPVYQDPSSPKTYNLSRYHDVAQFGKHPAMSNVAPDWVQRGPWGMFRDSVIVKDPPEHTALRRISNHWFTPKLARQWAEAATEEVNRVLDGLGPSGLTEAFRNLALMPSHHAMCRALGLPNDGYDTGSDYMRDAMIGLGAAISAEEEERCQVALTYLLDRVDHYLAEARKNPQPGAVSSWIELAANGTITDRQLREALLLFWASATPNAAYLITGGMEIFARQPEVLELWRTSPEKHPAILNEIARLHTAEMSIERFTTAPIEIHGVSIPAGSHIRFLIASANRDPEVFHDPHRFDLDRPAETPPHLSFGLGAHFCPGTNISLAETSAVFDTIAARVKRVELAGVPIYGHDDRSARYLRLPVRLVM